MLILQTTRRSAAVLAGGILVLLASLGSQAQAPVDMAQAQARYNTEIARCNSGTLAAPAREACVRAAGMVLDRARGTPPVPELATTNDGRATVMTPTPLATGATAPTSTSISEPIRTSTDGRSTIVVPADAAAGGTIGQ